MEEDEYAIVSKKEFLALKKELDRLKKNPLEGSEAGESLQAGIDNLSKSLNVMLEVFKQASEDLKLEEHESETVVKQLGPLSEKIDTLIDQNQKIAKGIVAIADMVKEKLDELVEKSEKPRLPPLTAPAPRSSPAPAPSPRPFGPPPGPSSIPPLGPPGGLPQFGAPEGMDSDFPPMGPPQMAAPGQFPPPPDRSRIMGGLMK
jgi:hypothetical protein